MDPKMDSGCFDPSEEFEELYDVSKPLLPEEVLGIIDQLICFEVSLRPAVSENHSSHNVLDGLAHGLPSFSNTIHKCLY